MDGAEVRTWVDTNDKVDSPKRRPRGQGEGARAGRAGDVPVARRRLRRRRLGPQHREHAHHRRAVEGPRQGPPQAARLPGHEGARRLLQEARRDPAVREHVHGRRADAARRRAQDHVVPLRVRRLRRDRPQLPVGDRGVGDQRGAPAPDQARLPHAVAGREPLRPHARRLPGQRVADRLRRRARRGRLADRLVPAGQARRLGRAGAGRPRRALRRRPRRDPVRAAGPEDRDPDLRGARSLQRLRRRSASRHGRRRSSSRA